MQKKNPILLSFGKKVQAYREQMGFTQEQLADKAKVHRTYIGTVERGETNITLLNIHKLSSALNISPIELIS